MTNFIYNMQDELFHLNMILPVGEFSPIKKLVDHIEAQGKQLRELDAAITKKNATIEKYEREKKELQNSNNYLIKKVDELNEGIRNSEDLTWKQKYDALLQSSEQAIGALQKKCQEYKNADTIDTFIKTNKELEEKNKKLKKQVNSVHGVISLSSELNTKIDNQSKEITRLLKNQETLKAEMVNKEQIISSLDATINHKNNLLDEYMTKCNNLEHNYKEEVRMKEHFKCICFRHEETIKKLKRDNDILRGRINEISDLAESIAMLCDDEE